MKRITLYIVYIAVVLHFIKDITQDILRINSPMDIFGNIEENTSFMSPLLQNMFFYGLGGLSFLAEILLLIYIPKIISGKAIKTDRTIVKYSFIYLTAFLLICTLLDPNINPFL